jgi:hypothetical protein
MPFPLEAKIDGLLELFEDACGQKIESRAQLIPKHVNIFLIPNQQSNPPALMLGFSNEETKTTEKCGGNL